MTFPTIDSIKNEQMDHVTRGVKRVHCVEFGHGYDKWS